jgi:hypothetical protein
VLLDKPEIALVLDEVYADPGDLIEVRFHPGVDYTVEGDFVMLEGASGKMALIPIAGQGLEIAPGRHATQFVNATIDFFWIDYFDTEVKAQDDKTTIATLIVPVSDQEEAHIIAASLKMSEDRSGNLSVTFSCDGKDLIFDFTSTKEGLILK